MKSLKWLRRHWPWLLYAVTALNYAVLLYVPHWLSVQLGCTVLLPDMDTFFASADFESFASCIKTAGKPGFALFSRWYTYGADLWFPAVFAATLTAMTFRAASQLPRFAGLNSWVKLLAAGALPAAYALCDYLENQLVRLWLLFGREVVREGDITAVTTTKFTLLAIALAIVALSFVAGLNQRKAT